MVNVGNIILINKKIEAKVIALIQIENTGRWLISYMQPDGTTDFFFEGDEDFCVVKVA